MSPPPSVDLGADVGDHFLQNLDDSQLDEDEFGPAASAPKPALPPKLASTKSKPAGGDSSSSTKKARSRKRKSGMPAILWPVCGLAGGAIAGAIWVAVAVAFHRQIGFIAWGVGAGTGLGVAMAAGRRAGTGSGLLAVGVAFCVILASKFAVALLLVNQLVPQLAVTENREQQVLMRLASQIAAREEQKGTSLKWPADKSLEDATELTDFPESVQKEAQQSWDQKTAEARHVIAEIDAVHATVKGFMVGVAFVATFSFYDLLWFFLAGASAFRIGRGIG